MKNHNLKNQEHNCSHADYKGHHKFLMKYHKRVFAKVAKKQQQRNTSIKALKS